MGLIAYHSGQLEGAAWDRWELHTAAMIEAYTMGQRHVPLTIYHFLKWHGAILPHGGSLREGNPVSLGMGESFQPTPVHRLPLVVNSFVRTWLVDIEADPPMVALAKRHFDQWRMHPFADGNKRHARLITIYGCGYLNLPPVDLSLPHKSAYLDALAQSNVEALADLLARCRIAL